MLTRVCRNHPRFPCECSIFAPEHINHAISFVAASFLKRSTGNGTDDDDDDDDVYESFSGDKCTPVDVYLGLVKLNSPSQFFIRKAFRQDYGVVNVRFCQTGSKTDNRACVLRESGTSKVSKVLSL